MTLAPHTLPLPAFMELLASGTVLEESPSLGPKVIALPGDRYFKILRVKNRFSTWGLLNPAKRFVRNAEGLWARGVPTVEVETLYRLPHLKCWAVSYRGLPGISVRQLLKDGQLTEERLDQLVSFVRELHDKGIYFRGLHPGNILLMPDGRFGLIDILDCYFRPCLLGWQRERNFKHFFRYAEVRELEMAIRARYAAIRHR